MAGARGASSVMSCAVAAAIAVGSMGAWAAGAGSKRLGEPPPCPPSWVVGLASRPPSLAVWRLATIDGSAGPRLLAFGVFDAIGTVVSRRAAEWDGLVWRALPADPATGLIADAILMAADGIPRLHVAGSFSTLGGTPIPNIGRQTESGWEALGGGADDDVAALAVGRLAGLPEALFVGGEFEHVGGIEAAHVARWDGAAWSPLGPGLDGPVRTLAIAELGGREGAGVGGPSLFAGGDFTRSGDMALSGIARWDGQAWGPLGAGVDGAVWDMVVADVGEGLSLYVAGEFEVAGEVASPGVARWDGQAWHALGSPLPPGKISIAVADLGQGPTLYAANTWTRTPGQPGVGLLAAWSGAGWTTVAELAGAVLDLEVLQRPGSTQLMLGGGSSTQVDGVAIPGLASFDGTTWSTPTPRRGVVGDMLVYAALHRVEDGKDVVYLGGGVGGDEARALVRRWDGERSLELAPEVGTLPYGYVADVIEHDDGSGSALHAVGKFIDEESGTTWGVARWTGTVWEYLDSQIPTCPVCSPTCPTCDVFAAASFDDGAGRALYVSGRFTSIGGVPALNVARCRAGVWEPLGGGIAGQVWSLHVHPGPDGPMLVAGTDIGGVGGGSGQVLAWDGQTWTPLGGSDDAAAATGGSVLALETFDDGSGTALYAGVNSGESGCVRRWQGGRWSDVGDALHGSVAALAVHDDGTGPALYAGGWCTLLQDMGPHPFNLARWSGVAWQPVGFSLGPIEQAGIASGVMAIEGAGGLGLVVGGQFRDALDGPASGAAADGIAVWGDGGSPHVAVPPKQVVASVGQSVSLSVGVQSKPAAGDLMIQWRRNGAPLADGDGVSGATTSTLVLSQLGLDDAGTYDVEVVNDCGSDIGGPAEVTVLCAADLDADGSIDGADIGLLLAAWGGASRTADLNGDGVVGEADLALLLAGWTCGVER